MEQDELQMATRGDILIFTSNHEPNTVVLPDGPYFGDSSTKKALKLSQHILQSIGMVGGRKFYGYSVDGIKNNETSRRLLGSLGAAINYKRNGGRFVNNDYQDGVIRFEVEVQNFENIRPFLTPISDDVRLRGTVHFMLTKPDDISDEHFSKEKQVMIHTFQNLSEHEIQLFQIALLDMSADDFGDKCSEIENVATESKNNVLIKKCLESVGKILDKPFICTECMAGFTTKNNAIKHLKSKHDRRNIDLAEEERRTNFPVQRAVQNVQDMNDRIQQQMQEKIDELEREVERKDRELTRAREELTIVRAQYEQNNAL